MGTRLNRLAKAVLTSTHNLCFEQKYEKYRRFLSENFQFLEMKFSMYLNRRVVVMISDPHINKTLIQKSPVVPHFSEIKETRNGNWDIKHSDLFMH